jgi:hypothetical protein
MRDDGKDAPVDRAATRDNEPGPLPRAVDANLEKDERGIDGPEGGRSADDRGPVGSIGSDRAASPAKDAGSERESAERPSTSAERGTDAEAHRSAGARDAHPAGSERQPRRDSTDSAMAWFEDARRDTPGLAPTSTESAAQAYVEDPRKVSRVRGRASSFGTIGDTLEERMAFWDLVNEHESSAGGRTQSRLVLELPHEATARMRHEIVRRYVSEFEDKGLPYWATIHEPTKRNDSRNYHAHVVFSDRPMAIMPHPETGKPVWDFTIEQQWRTRTSGNLRISHPYRQDRDPQLRERGWVKASRARFAGIVNDVMVENGMGVRYDPRSYKDMGLDVTPMVNVDRILQDKANARPFVVMDAAWTRRMIDAEMREAALRRDETYQQLREVETRIAEAAKRTRAPKLANRDLPRSMRLRPGHGLAPTAAERLAAGMLEVRRDALATRFVDEATARTLSHVIEATSPRRGAPRPLDGPVPDAASMATLHAAAKEEAEAFGRERAARDRDLAATAARFTRAWVKGAAGAGVRAASAKTADGQEVRRSGRRAESQENEASVRNLGRGAPDRDVRDAAPEATSRTRERRSPMTTNPSTARPRYGAGTDASPASTAIIARGAIIAPAEATPPSQARDPMPGREAMRRGMAAAMAAVRNMADGPEGVAGAVKSLAETMAAIARETARTPRPAEPRDMGSTRPAEDRRGPSRAQPATTPANVPERPHDTGAGADHDLASRASNRSAAPQSPARSALSPLDREPKMTSARLEFEATPRPAKPVPPTRSRTPPGQGSLLSPEPSSTPTPSTPNTPSPKAPGRATLPGPEPTIKTAQNAPRAREAAGFDPTRPTPTGRAPDPTPASNTAGPDGSTTTPPPAAQDANRTAAEAEAEARRKRRKALLSRRNRGPGL